VNKILHIPVLVVLLFTAGCTSNSQNEFKLNSSEYKLLLDSARFADIEQGFRDYWTIIKAVAEEEGIPVAESEHPYKIKHKEISFFDTRNYDLKKNGYILRRKIKYKEGHREPGSEFSLKFRNTMPEIAATADVVIGDGYTPKDDKIELESDIVYFSAENGGKEITFSVQNLVELDHTPSFRIGEFARIYPVLSTFGLPEDTELELVAEASADERMMRPGKFEFGDGLKGRIDLTVWLLDLGGEEVRIPEFSFDHPFPEDRDYSEEALRKCTTFIDRLQEEAPDWVVPGKLKAAFLFEYEE
jgi:hypothetical protein|tara:strand:+ start:1595 stop:2497 length:903 start_codon:yes stop_codon:yes gene_type:complete